MFRDVSCFLESCMRRLRDYATKLGLISCHGYEVLFTPLGNVRLDWFAISLNLGIGFLRVKSAHLYKDGIVSLLIKQ